MGKWDNVIIWKDTDKKFHRDEGLPPGPVLSDHRDPTADIAIANVTREEKRKRLAAEAAEANKAQKMIHANRKSTKTRRPQYGRQRGKQ